MFDTFKNRLEISGVLTTITALRISAGRSTEPIDSDLPVIKDAVGYPFIPGSSFKGAMRSRLEAFLRGIDPNLAANPANEDEWSITADRINTLKTEPGKSDAQLTQEILDETDFVSKLFGSPWLAGKLQIQDLAVDPDCWFGQYQERDGVSIDRDTETAANAKLYDFQVVPAATEFKFRAIVENADDAELGLLLLGLHQFETQQIPLGGGRSRGLGVVELEINRWQWTDGSSPELLMQYLEQQIGSAPKADATAQLDSELRERWSTALLNGLRDDKPKLRSASKTTATANP
ncbi:MAG: CRISPR-associated RAMP protein [Synechococcales cyanobacterium RM1_1_8]|nr:CRISPR-associated RAMP protein [Synechococcales cyanobacterium RM1_1_8]